MSKIYDFRESLKTHIVNADIGLSESDVVIDRQSDLITKINRVVARRDGNGVALTIGAARGRNVNPKSLRSLRFDVTFLLRLWVLPVYDTQNLLEEDIAEPLIKLLHGAQLNGTPHCSQTLHVDSFQDVPDPEFLLREITINQAIHL